MHTRTHTHEHTHAHTHTHTHTLKELFASIDSRVLPVCGDEIVGAALAQVAVEQDAKPILTQLLTAEGPELCVLPAVAVLGQSACTPGLHGAIPRSASCRQVDVGEEFSMTWDDVMTHVRSVGMVAVG
jgi:hypothetical protein